MSATIRRRPAPATNRLLPDQRKAIETLPDWVPSDVPGFRRSGSLPGHVVLARQIILLAAEDALRGTAFLRADVVSFATGAEIAFWCQVAGWDSNLVRAGLLRCARRAA